MTETMTAAQLNAEMNRGNKELRHAFGRLWGRARKYNNKPQVVNGQRFDSIREAKRHGELVLLQRAGRISKLERQVTFDLVVNGTLVGRIRPDWTYLEDGAVIADDCKGKQTDVHKLRWKLAKAVFPQISWRLS